MRFLLLSADGRVEGLLLAALHKKYGVPYNPTQEEEEVLAELVAQTEEKRESRPSGDSESMSDHVVSSNPELRQRLVSMCRVFHAAHKIQPWRNAFYLG